MTAPGSGPARRRGPGPTLVAWVVAAGAIYALLMVAWPLLAPAYRAGFRGAGNVLMGGPFADVRVRFVTFDDVRDVVDPRFADHADVALDFRHALTGARAVRMIDSRFFGYVPTVTLLALALSTPLPWRRRGRALAWGMAAVQAAVALRVILYVASVLAGPTLAALHPSAFWGAVLEAATATVSQSTLASYVLPLVIWAATTFRSGDWQRLLGE